MTAVSAASWSGLSPSKTRFSYRFDVGGRGPLDGGAAGLGENHERAPGVGRALLAGDEAAPLHPGEVVGHAALLPGQRVGDLEHPQPARGGLAEHDQHVVVRERHPEVVLQLPVHPGVQLGGHLQQATPGPLLVLGQPAAHGHQDTGN